MHQSSILGPNPAPGTWIQMAQVGFPLSLCSPINMGTQPTPDLGVPSKDQWQEPSRNLVLKGTWSSSSPATGVLPLVFGPKIHPPPPPQPPQNPPPPRNQPSKPPHSSPTSHQASRISGALLKRRPRGIQARGGLLLRERQVQPDASNAEAPHVQRRHLHRKNRDSKTNSCPLLGVEIGWLVRRGKGTPQLTLWIALLLPS